MADLAGLGRLLLIAGAVLMAIGLLLVLSDRLPAPGWLGRLPGDLVFRRGNVTVFVPIVTSIIVSIILTIIVSLLFRRQ